MPADGYITTDWNRADRSEVLGLHLLHMAARRDWIVRHDLAIDVMSRTYAVQHYEVDIDRDRVDELFPAGLKREKSDLIWLPVLRIPSIRSADQRVTQVVRTGGRGLPLIPQSRVRHHLGAGLAWLMINRMPRLQDATKTQQALVRNGLRRCVRSYLAMGRGGLETNLAALRADPRTRLSPGDPDSSLLNWDWIESVFDHRAPTDDSYAAGVSECIAYTRFGYLAVVGIEQTDRYPHVGLDLLPADLDHTRYNGLRDARQLLGFEPPDPDGFHRVRRRPWYAPKVAFSLLTAPSLYHLEIPLPEIGDLDGVHVQITTPEEVSIAPAVLHHDHRCDRFDHQGRAVGQIIQARTRHDDAVPSRLETLARSLPAVESSLTHEANRKLLIEELTPIARSWRRRILRIDAVQRLSRPRPRRRLHRRLLAPLRYRASRREASEPPPPPTVAVRTDEMVDQTASLIEYLGKDGPPAAAGERLGALLATEQAIPHLEMSGDDDLRDHVAHFHVDNTESVFHRSTDSRPVVSGILRVSTQGRTGPITLAAGACSISSVLLALLLALSHVSLDAFNSEAIVALLLLVPGIAVTLVGRAPGDSLVNLVLGRAQQLTLWSLVAPGVAAASLAVLFGSTSQARDGVEPTGSLAWLPTLGVRGLLTSMLILSLIPTAAAWWNALSHRHRFNWDAQVLGRLGYRDEVEAALGDRPAHDETTTATVNSAKVAELIDPALFQISRPHQRFMVVVTLPRDSPNAFQDAVEVLERLPSLVDHTANGPSSTVATDTADGTGPTTGQAVVEASLVTSVATTGMTMSVVSTDLSTGAPPIRSDQIETAVADELRKRRSHSQATVAAIEIEEDTSYFRYRSVTYRHFAFTGRVGPDGPDPLPRSTRQALLADLLELDVERRRIAYLYFPIRPDADGKDEAIRVGFAESPDWGAEDQNLALLLVAVAQRHSASVAPTRMVADEPGRGTDYDWPEMSARGLAPFMLLSAGENHLGDLRRAVGVIGKHRGIHLEGGTVLTDGGYTSRALRVWSDQTTVDALCAVLNEDRGGQGGQGTQHRSGTGWYQTRSEPTDVMAEAANPTTEPARDRGWVYAWLRWRLDTGSGGLIHLLAGMRDWHDGVDGLAWQPRFINVEFLSSRSGRRVTSGKARCRIGIDAGREADIDDLAEQVRRSLESQLHVHFGDHLANSRRYLVVEAHEPPDPLDLLPDQMPARTPRPGGSGARP